MGAEPWRARSPSPTIICSVPSFGEDREAEAAGLLQAGTCRRRSGGELRWSSLKWQPASFIDDRLRDSESDLLYAVERTAGGAPAWLYVLLEHQSREREGRA